MVVSHDRDFLNTVTTDIIHLHDERLHYYRGNFAQVNRNRLYLIYIYIYTYAQVLHIRILRITRLQ